MFGTEIKDITFIFICFFTGVLFYSIWNLVRAEKKSLHLDFSLLIFSVIMNNLSSGLFPDPNIPINEVSQNILAYSIGFSTLLYIYFYFYKYYDINFGKRFNKFTIVIYLFFCFVIGFIIPYTITQNLSTSRIFFIIISLIVVMLIIVMNINQIKQAFSKDKSTEEKLHQVFGIAGLMSIISVPITMLLLGDNQIVEQTLFSSGFILASFEYLIYNPEDKVEINREVIEEDPKDLNYNLTKREEEIFRLIIEQHTTKYATIADSLNISEKTLSAHVSRIYRKVDVKNRREFHEKFNKKKVNKSPF